MARNCSINQFSVEDAGHTGMYWDFFRKWCILVCLFQFREVCNLPDFCILVLILCIYYFAAILFYFLYRKQGTTLSRSISDGSV